MQKTLTVKWNRDRGLLDKFDPKLELKMLSEEAKEFYAAETLAHMLAEYADFLFVLDGTKAKFGSQIITTHVGLIDMMENYNCLRDWAYTVKEDMKNCLNSALGDHYHEIDGLLRVARDVVIYNNGLKGKKKEGGKIVKNKDHVDPVDQIQKYLDRLGF